LHVPSDLERIADHATNIAEDVIFMAEGRIVRHHVMEFRKRQQERGEGEASTAG
jgi:phosphate transport system protein